jgi:hypothetical protein
VTKSERRESGRFLFYARKNMISTIVQRYDRQIHRFLEFIPGFLTWLFLLSPIWLGLLAPKVVIYYITFLAVFWCYLAIRHTVGILLGYAKYRKEMETDWLSECRQLDYFELPDKSTLPPSLSDVRHFILIPVVNEPVNVLKDSINALLSQTFDVKTITLVYTIEEKFASEVKERILTILGDNVHKFDEVLFYSHPAGIPGEAKGVAGANRTWGARHAVEHLQKTDRNVRNYIFTTIDADHVLDRQFLSRLAHLYLTSDKRDNRFYTTALHLFNNNIWEVPLLMRIEANSITLGGLSESIVSHPALKDTFASYSASLQTLIDAKYWDVVTGIDDTIFFWRAFFVRNGDFIGTFHYIPYSADAVQGGSLWRSHVSMYKQLLRWGWGAIAIPISLKEFLKNKAIPPTIKALWTIKHFENKIFLKSIVFLMTFGIPLITLVNKEARQSISVYSLPEMISVILTIALIMLIPVTIFRSRIIKPVPESWPFWRKFLVIFEGPMVVINLFTFSFFPFIEAQTRMMFGRRMKDLYHTPKVR